MRKGMRWASTVLFALTTPLTLAIGARADSNSVGTAGCLPFTDPYSVPLSQDVACGDQVFPRVGTSHMPDGSTRYSYLVDGLETTFTVPPAGFNYVGATDQQLAAYGLPTRPTDAAGLALWRAQMQHLRISAPPTALVMTPTRNDSSSIWSGYVAYSSSSSYYYFAEIRYNEPQALSTSCSNNSESTWTGLGGWYTGNLAQDGTSINDPSIAQHQSWYEILPASEIALPVYGHPGYGFYAEVNHIGGGFNFYVHDTYSGQGIQFQVGSSSYDGQTAESIIERPTVNGSTRNLTNYSYLNVLDAWANGNSSSNGLGNYPHFEVDMYNGSDLLATNSGLSNSGQTFTNYFKACS